MSFRCSVLGHRYGDPEVEREREEDGSEVVITVREITTCSRCGHERVVSENKEVTTLETPAEIVEDDLDERTASSSTETERTRQHGVSEASSSVDEPTGTEDDIVTPDEDDAVILDDEGTADEETREPGEWPEEAESDDPETESAGMRAPGEWPEESTDDDTDPQWQSLTDPEPRPLDDTVEQPNSAITVPEGEFRCPECGYSTPVEESPLRAGDYCPECHRGALEHQSE